MSAASGPNATDETDPLIESVLSVDEVRAVPEELLEAGIDAFIDNPVVDAIPVVGSVKALAKGATAWRDGWLNKKLVALLYELGEVSDADLRRWVRRLNTEQGVRETGERLTALVDAANSVLKARLIGRVFRTYLDGDCERGDLLRTVEMIEAALTEDLEFLLKTWDEGYETSECARLISVGLLEDRAQTLALEASRPPAASEAGALLIRSVSGIFN